MAPPSPVNPEHLPPRTRTDGGSGSQPGTRPASRLALLGDVMGTDATSRLGPRESMAPRTPTSARPVRERAGVGGHPHHCHCRDRCKEGCRVPWSAAQTSMATGHDLVLGVPDDSTAAGALYVLYGPVTTTQDIPLRRLSPGRTDRRGPRQASTRGGPCRHRCGFAAHRAPDSSLEHPTRASRTSPRSLVGRRRSVRCRVCSPMGRRLARSWTVRGPRRRHHGRRLPGDRRRRSRTGCRGQ